jgi:hypothetical protein
MYTCTQGSVVLSSRLHRRQPFKQQVVHLSRVVEIDVMTRVLDDDGLNIVVPRSLHPLARLEAASVIHPVLIAVDE